MKLLHTIALLFAVTFICSADRRNRAEYTPVNEDEIFGIDAPAPNTINTFYGSSFDYAVFEFSNIMWANLRNKREQQQMEQDRQSSIAKLQMIKSQYGAYENYPDRIIDGWHSAIATDNVNFCKDLKILVRNNRIVKVVIEDYIPLRFISTGEIKKAKGLITVKNLNGQQLNLFEIYFLYDIEQQAIVQEPQQAGYVCFWTNINDADGVKLKVDGKMVEPFTGSFDEDPDCFTKGMVCRIMRPGTHSYEGDKRGGAGKWSDNFEVKPGYCLRIKVGRGR